MKRLVSGILAFIIWMLLDWTFRWPDVAVGLVFSAVVSLLAGNILPNRPTRLIDPRRWLWMLLYLPYFLYYCIKANLDVAYRVLHPDMPIRPGIVKVRTVLKSDMAKTFLASSITLTPGTLVVDIVGEDLYVHWINVRGEDPEEHTREIVKAFEPFIRRIFD
jgi:multicomponent Na+:H+ antiporter subunit E